MAPLTSVDHEPMPRQTGAVMLAYGVLDLEFHRSFP